MTEALDKVAYYVIPRVNPDGAEAYLTGELLRDPNPTDNDKDGKFDEDPPEDINGAASCPTCAFVIPTGRSGLIPRTCA